MLTASFPLRACTVAVAFNSPLSSGSSTCTSIITDTFMSFFFLKLVAKPSVRCVCCAPVRCRCRSARTIAVVARGGSRFCASSAACASAASDNPSDSSSGCACVSSASARACACFPASALSCAVYARLPASVCDCAVVSAGVRNLADRLRAPCCAFGEVVRAVSIIRTVPTVIVTVPVPVVVVIAPVVVVVVPVPVIVIGRVTVVVVPVVVAVVSVLCSVSRPVHVPVPVPVPVGVYVASPVGIPVPVVVVDVSVLCSVSAHSSVPVLAPASVTAPMSVSVPAAVTVVVTVPSCVLMSVPVFSPAVVADVPVVVANVSALCSVPAPVTAPTPTPATVAVPTPVVVIVPMVAVDVSVLCSVAVPVPAPVTASVSVTDSVGASMPVSVPVVVVVPSFTSTPTAFPPVVVAGAPMVVADVPVFRSAGGWEKTIQWTASPVVGMMCSRKGNDTASRSTPPCLHHTCVAGATGKLKAAATNSALLVLRNPGVPCPVSVPGAGKACNVPCADPPLLVLVTPGLESNALLLRHAPYTSPSVLVCATSISTTRTTPSTSPRARVWLVCHPSMAPCSAAAPWAHPICTIPCSAIHLLAPVSASVSDPASVVGSACTSTATAPDLCCCAIFSKAPPSCLSRPLSP